MLLLTSQGKKPLFSGVFACDDVVNKAIADSIANNIDDSIDDDRCVDGIGSY